MHVLAFGVHVPVLRHHRDHVLMPALQRHRQRAQALDFAHQRIGLMPQRGIVLRPTHRWRTQ
jgi:hypothetical protein